MLRHAFAFFVFALTAAGCNSAEVIEAPIVDPQARVFHASFDEIWRDIQLAVRKYPIRVNNIDAGILETEYIKGDKLFIQPIDPKPLPGLRYKITVRAVKGQIDGKPAIKVTVFKSSEVQQDFFTGFKPVPSNGLEELAIMYRISRFLELDEMLSKSAGAPR